jgi:hypothetical protein
MHIIWLTYPLPSPPDLDPDPHQDFELSGSGSASKQCGSTALGSTAFSLFLHYLIYNCFVKRTKNMMAKEKIIKIKGTVSLTRLVGSILPPSINAIWATV